MRLFAPIALLFIRALQTVFPKDSYILFDNIYEENAECIDTYSLFLRMRERNIKAYYCIYAKNPMLKELKRQQQMENVIVLKKPINHSYEFIYKLFWKLPRAKYVITSFGGLRQRLTKFLYNNKHITYLRTGHGSIYLKTFILSTPYTSPEKYNKSLVSNEAELKLFEKFGWQKENLSIIGLSRWDLLKRGPAKQKATQTTAQNTIFAMFTWRTSFSRANIEQYGCEIKDSVYYQGLNAFINNKCLNDMLERTNTKLKMALHHSLLDQTDFQMFDITNSNIELVPSTNISQYIGTSDLFITDYSSLFFDFLFLDIPTIFYRFDFDDTRLIGLDKDDMVHARSLDGTLFNCCYDIDTCLQTIQRYIDNGFELEPENKEKATRLFSVRENIRDKIIEYLEKS